MRDMEKGKRKRRKGKEKEKKRKEKREELRYLLPFIQERRLYEYNRSTIISF